MDEHNDDIQTAKTTSFNATSSSEDRKRKRMEIRSQSLFTDSTSSSGHSGSSSSKQARLTLMKACGLSKGKNGESTVKGTRNSLGIRTGSTITGKTKK